MFFCTLSPLCMCGDNDTINFFAIIFCQLFYFFALRSLIMPITVALPTRT
jgi:hypothetical protein